MTPVRCIGLVKVDNSCAIVNDLSQQIALFANGQFSASQKFQSKLIIKFMWLSRHEDNRIYQELK